MKDILIAQAEALDKLRIGHTASMPVGELKILQDAANTLRALAAAQPEGEEDDTRHCAMCHRTLKICRLDLENCKLIGKYAHGYHVSQSPSDYWQYAYKTAKALSDHLAMRPVETR